LVPHAGRLDVLQFAPCFIAGVLTYRLSKQATPRLPFVVLPAFLAITISVFLFAPQYDYAPAAWLLCLATGAFLPFLVQPRSLLIKSVSAWIAKYSYGIYLTHVFCLWMAFVVLRAPRVIQWAAFAALCAGIPFALYHMVEEPMIHLGRKLTASRKVVNTEIVPTSHPVLQTP
jgi:peptidoglycan/LPS O-acetylase OafA/YrhL